MCMADRDTEELTDSTSLSAPRESEAGSAGGPEGGNARVQYDPVEVSTSLYGEPAAASLVQGRGVRRLFSRYRVVTGDDLSQALGSAYAPESRPSYDGYLSYRDAMMRYRDLHLYSASGHRWHVLKTGIRHLLGDEYAGACVEARREWRERGGPEGPTVGEWLNDVGVWSGLWAADLRRACAALRKDGPQYLNLDIGGTDVRVPLDPYIFGKMPPPKSSSEISTYLVSYHLVKACRALEALLLGAYAMGMEPVGEGDAELPFVETMLDEMFWLSLQDRLEDYWKWCLASMAYERLDDTQESPPVAPSWCHTGNCPFRGRLRGWWLRKTRKFDEHSVTGHSMSNWLLQCKKAFPEISHIRVTGAVRDWYEVFTVPPALPLTDPRLDPRAVPGDDRFTPAIRAEVLGALEELYSRALRLGRHRLNPPLTRMVPLPAAGTKATCESGRGEGGSWNELHRCIAEGFEVIEEYRQELMAGLEAMPDDRDARHGVANVLAQISTQTHILGTFQSMDGSRVVEVHGVTPPGFAESVLRGVLSDVAKHLVLVPHGIPEPFKVRVISKGRAVAYWICRLVQKHMHRCLAALPEFELIGLASSRSIADVVDDVVGPVPLGPEQYVMVSGDYKASTDSLRECASAMAVESWCRLAGYGPEVSALVMESMCHNLVMKHGADKTPVPQASAQPMGSPVSFPFLCALNWAASVVGLRRAEGGAGPYGRRKIGSSGIVINGDDILFACRRSAVKDWSYITSAIGLKPSVGKNYVSWHFGNVNSAMFRQVRVPLEASCRGHYRGPVAPCRWWFVPYVNVSVLRPSPRPTPDEFLVSAPALQAIWQNGWSEYNAGQCARPEQCFKKIWDPVISEKLWLQEWSRELAHVPKFVNWFIPRDLGGFGLTTSWPLVYRPGEPGVPLGPYVEVTPAQRRVAAYLRDARDPTTLHRQLPGFGSADAVISVHADERHLYEGLANMGLVVERFLDDFEQPLTITGAAQILSLSGYSTGPAEKTVHFDGRDWSVQPATVPEERVQRARTKFIRAWTRASRSTGREMDLADMVIWKPRRVGWAVHHDWIYHDLPLAVRAGDWLMPRGVPHRHHAPYPLYPREAGARLALALVPYDDAEVPIRWYPPVRNGRRPPRDPWDPPIPARFLEFVVGPEAPPGAPYPRLPRVRAVEHYEEELPPPNGGAGAPPHGGDDMQGPDDYEEMDRWLADMVHGDDDERLADR